MAIRTCISRARGSRDRVRHNERGAVLAELSLALIIVMPIFAGIVRTSLMMSQQMDLIQASRILTRDSFSAASGATTGIELCAALRAAAGNSLASVGLHPQHYLANVSATNTANLPDSFPSNTVMVSVTPLGQGGLFTLQAFPTFVFVRSQIAQELRSCSGVLEEPQIEEQLFNWGY